LPTRAPAVFVVGGGAPIDRSGYREGGRVGAGGGGGAVVEEEVLVLACSAVEVRVCAVS
jgi:hypothetical protein